MYNLQPSYLGNYSGATLLLFITFGIWIISRALLYSLKSSENTFFRIVKAVFGLIARVAINFLVTQLYGGFPDIIFYTVLEIKTLVLEFGWSDFSFAMSLLLTVLGLCLLGLHCRYLFYYHRLKSTATSRSPQSLETFEQKHEWLQAVYKDFSNATRIKHGFLFILVLRQTAVSIIASTLTALPQFQAHMFVLCSVSICGYLLFRRPFQLLYDNFAQLFFELCVLVVYICVLITAMIDPNSQSAPNNYLRLGYAVTVINVILKWTSIAHLCIKTLWMAWTTYKAYVQKSKAQVTVLNSLTLLNQHQTTDNRDADVSAMNTSAFQLQSFSTASPNINNTFIQQAEESKQADPPEEVSVNMRIIEEDQITTSKSKPRPRDLIRPQKSLNVPDPTSLHSLGELMIRPQEDKPNRLRLQSEVIDLGLDTQELSVENRGLNGQDGDESALGMLQPQQIVNLSQNIRRKIRRVWTTVFDEERKEISPEKKSKHIDMREQDIEVDSIMPSQSPTPRQRPEAINNKSGSPGTTREKKELRRNVRTLGRPDFKKTKD